jgi:23S rRNA pseudouridine1911/1915/1917 synthase
MKEMQVSFTYSAPEAQRLDKYLVSQMPEVSRSRIQAWVRAGLVTVDGQVAEKNGLLLDKPALVIIDIPPVAKSELIPEPIPLDIIFENDDLLVVNKPAGMVVHPSAGHSTGTLVHAVLAHAPNIEGVGGVQRPGVVHRLDKNTSGIILVAKNDRTHQVLQAQFRARTVRKTYLALVDGIPPTPAGRVEAAIARDPVHRQRMAVMPPGRGREAVSEYRVRTQFKAHTLLEVSPLTGRTHQIRVHLAFLGVPVVGDRLYGRKRPSLPVDRHFLHAAGLTVMLPGESRPQTFLAELPLDLSTLLEGLQSERK